MAENGKSKRQDLLRCKWLPNGNLRFYQDNEKKDCISELNSVHQKNVCNTILTTGSNKVMIEKDI